MLHDRVLRDLERRRRAVKFYENAIARLDGEWAGRGEKGERYIDPAHPYGQDLDLFGAGSLFELLSTARTHIGEDTLARWLLAPAPPETLRERNEAIEELRPRVDLREDLAVLAERGARPAWSRRRWRCGARRLRCWAAPTGCGPRVLTALGTLALAAMLTAGLDWSGIVTFPAGGRDGGALRLSARTAGEWVLSAPEGAGGGRDRRRGGQGGASARPACPRCWRGWNGSASGRRCWPDCGRPSTWKGRPSSKRLARLAHLAERIDSRENLFVRMLELFILWTPRLAAEVEEWRRHSGRRCAGGWRRSGEMEALNSLASHAYEHPSDTFAEFAAEAAAARGRRRRASAAPRGPGGAQLGPHRRRASGAGGERVEHVRQEHAAADSRDERGAGAGGRAGPREAAAALRRWRWARPSG